MASGIHQVTTTEMGHFGTSAYKVKPQNLHRYIRSHLPGWECLGTETWHHHNVVVLRKKGTDLVVLCMEGTTPTKLRNLLKPKLAHNWVRNIRNEITGRPAGNVNRFVTKVTDKHGSPDLWCTHSGGAAEVLAMNPEGDFFLINPHPPKTGGLPDNAYAIRTTDDVLTQLFPRCNDQVQDIGFGGHGMTGVREALSRSDWDSIFPESMGSFFVKTSDAGPRILLLKSEYPTPKFDDEGALYKAIYKKLKDQAYEAFKNEKLNLILNKTNNPPKVEKKLGRWFDVGKNHPVDKALRDKMKQEAYDSVTTDPEYLAQKKLLDTKEAFDRRIAAGELELIDALPDPSPGTVGLYDNLAQTGLTYGLTAGVFTFAAVSIGGVLQLRKNWSELSARQRATSIAHLIGVATIQGAKEGIISGGVAVAGKLLSNALEIAGYGCESVVPIAMQTFALLKVGYGCMTAPITRLASIDLSPYLPYARPRRAMATQDVDGISGAILGEEARRLASGEMQEGDEAANIERLTRELINQRYG